MFCLKTKLRHLYELLIYVSFNTHTLWNKSLCPSSKDVAFVAFHLNTSLLGKGGPVMHLKDTHYVEIQTYGRY